jgi:hypothetical protein
MQPGEDEGHEYELFEKREDGSAVRRGLVVGMQAAIAEAEKLARETSNEIFVLDANTRAIVHRIGGA